MAPTALTASSIALYDIFLYSKPKGYLPIVGRAAFVSAPIFASSATFILVSNGVGSIRKKDDLFNWFMGGFAVGPIFGAIKRSGMFGFNLGMALGLIGLLTKYAVQRDYTIFRDTQFYHTGFIATDWTFTKERKGNWTTGEK